MLAGIYKTPFSSADLNKEIVALFNNISNTGEPAPLQQLAEGFNRKQSNKLRRILEDAASPA